MKKKILTGLIASTLFLACKKNNDELLIYLDVFNRLQLAYVNQNNKYGSLDEIGVDPQLKVDGFAFEYYPKGYLKVKLEGDANDCPSGSEFLYRGQVGEIIQAEVLYNTPACRPYLENLFGQKVKFYKPKINEEIGNGKNQRIYDTLKSVVPYLFVKYDIPKYSEVIGDWKNFFLAKGNDPQIVVEKDINGDGKNDYVLLVRQRGTTNNGAYMFILSDKTSYKLNRVIEVDYLWSNGVYLSDGNLHLCEYEAWENKWSWNKEEENFVTEAVGY